MGQVVVVFCVLVTTEVQNVTGRLVCAATAKWVPMEIAVSCVQTMYRDQSALGVNLATGGCQRTAVKVLQRATPLISSQGTITFHGGFPLASFSGSDFNLRKMTKLVHFVREVAK